MTLVIRGALEADYPVMARLWTDIYPAHACTPETFTQNIQEGRANPLELHLKHWVAGQADEIVGYASIEQYAGLYHADRYHAGVLVTPLSRGQGIGTALAHVLHDHLKLRTPQEVLAGYRESDVAAAQLLTRNGFTEVQRYFDCHLDLTTFDFAAWEDKTAVPDGLTVVSYADLQRQQGEEQALHTYFDLFTETLRDVPAPGERTMPTLEHFRKRLQKKGLRSERVWLALTPEGQAVAFTELWDSEDADPQHLSIGFTCTRREWRGRGLALALKLCAMQAARQGGCRRITTNAESGNAPMLSLNDRLGFTRDEAYIECRWGKI